MKIIYNFNRVERVLDLPKEDIVAGRPTQDFMPDLDLGADQAVSRKHARIWLRDGHYWVQDLGSTYGTLVNEVKIDYKRQLSEGDVVRLGNTTLRVQAPAAFDLGEVATVPAGDSDTMITVRTRIREEVAPEAAAGAAAQSEVEFSAAISADAPTQIPLRTDETNFQQRLSLLYDLPLQFAAESRLDPLLQLIVERVVSVIPGAQRGALLLKDQATGKFLLKAHVPSGNPAVSETLARRAAQESKGFIWLRGEDADPSESVRHLSMATGMYAPLVWKDKTLGVICVDNPERNSAFVEADLRFLLVIAHYAAAAVANHQLQSELLSKSRVLERLLTNFSPKVRAKLLDKATAGKLRPGGEKSEVTLLFSDIRGFTNTTAKMDAADVVDMLNDYFSSLVQAIFQHDGTVDKFVGDAILAVFGSPESDPQHYEKAIYAAIAMQDAMRRVNDRRRAAGEVVCEIGIGIHCGEVLHGFIGAAERLEFTVIGDAVNKTSRYCDQAPAGQIYISPQVFEHVFRAVQTDPVTIATKHEGELKAFRVTGRKLQQ